MSCDIILVTKTQSQFSEDKNKMRYTKVKLSVFISFTQNLCLPYLLLPEAMVANPLCVISKAIPITGLVRPSGFQEAEAPTFQDSQHMQVVRLSALCAGHLYPPGSIAGTHFCYRLSQPQGHSAAGRIMSKKNSNDIIGNKTRDLPACSAVSQLTAPLSAHCALWFPIIH